MARYAFSPAGIAITTRGYSALMHFTGSTANTLLAGKYDAANAAASKVTGTAAKVTGSMGATP